MKAYVTPAEANSGFRVVIPRPGPTGTLKLLVVYENGAFTGDGKKRGIGSAKLVPYSFR